MALKPLWEQQLSLVRGQGFIIIDAGANEGQSVEQYRRWWPDAAVHCFEPDTRAFNILSSHWSTTPGVTLYQRALGATEGKLRFNLGGESYVSSVLPRVSGYTGHLPLVAVEEVAVTTLDNFLESTRVPYVNILKMDLQGFELETLKGAKRALTEEVFDIIFTEVWLKPSYDGAPFYWQIAQHLSDFKYKTWGIEVSDYPGNFEGRWGDAIFVSSRYAKILGY